MTKKVLDANELLCHNNTVKTHHVNRSDLKKKTWLSRQNIWFKKTILFISNKVYKDLKNIANDQNSFIHEWVIVSQPASF